MKLTKSDIVNAAFSEIRISGLTNNPTPSQKQAALDSLESIAYEFQSRNICINYNFTENPDLSDLTNTPPFARQALICSLAIRLAASFGKNIPDSLRLQTRQSVSTLSSATAVINMQSYPRRMPIGSGNTFRGRRFQKFYNNYNSTSLCADREMNVGDIDDFVESWTSYLDAGESIELVDITTDPNIALIHHSHDLTSVTIRIGALNSNNHIKLNGIYSVKISVVTTLGRRDTKMLNIKINTD